MSLPGHSPTTFTEPFVNFQATPNNQTQASSGDILMRPPQKEIPIVAWFFQNEKPWDPLSIQTGNRPVSQLGSSKVGCRPNGPAFSVYRGREAPPSDCDTTYLEPLPSDSGYGSLRYTKQSVISGDSVYGDYERSAETASVSNGLAELNFEHLSTPLSESWEKSGPTHVDGAVKIDGTDLFCQHCKNFVKTRSELKYVWLYYSSFTFESGCG